MASSGRLTPGEKGQIAAKLDTVGRAGSVSKSIRVFSNDPLRPSVSLLLKAFIRQ